MIIVIAPIPCPATVVVMNEPTNMTDQPENQHESTYALLSRSEEKSRNLFEIVIYPLLILSAGIAIWQFALQPVNFPAAGLEATPSVAFNSSSQCAIN